MSALSLRARLWVLRAILSHWRRRPLQLAALLVGLAAATALWSGVQALNAQARAAYAQAAQAFSGASLDALVAGDGGPVPQQAFPRLRRAGWNVSPVVETEVTLAGDRLRLTGVEPVTLPAEAGLALFGPESGETEGALTYPDFALPPGRTLIAPATLRALGLSEGARPEIAGRPIPPLTPSGAAAPGTLVMDIGFAQPLAGLQGEVSRLLLGAPTGREQPLSQVAPELRRQPGAPRADPARLADSFHLNLTAFGGLSFVVGLFIVHGAAGLAFEQRRPVFRTLRACGVSARGLAIALLIELVALALLAGAVGVACGYVVAGALLPDVAASLRGLYGARVPGALSLSPWWWAAGLGMSLLGAAVASAAAIARAARLPVLDSARPEAWRAAQSRTLRRQALAAAALAATALLLAAFGQGLIAGFALMGAILAAAALALPPILGAVLSRASRAARRPLWRWAFADGRQQLSGLSLALMALLLALAVNIGVGTMVDGFRRTFTDWLEDRLAADIYVRAPEGGRDALVAWLDARPDVTAAFEESEVEAPVGGWPTEIQGFQDASLYRDRWPLLAAGPDAWDRIAAGEAAMVSEQLARRLDLWTGDAVTLPTPAGPWRLRIAAIHADYGNPKGQVRVNLAALLAHLPDAERGRFAVMAEDPDALLTALRAPAGPPISQAIDQRALRAVSTSIFERTFAVTGALNALTLGVAGIALLTSLMTLSAARLPQLAPLWAMGVPRARLARLELAKTLGLALMTALLAIPLGVALAWALVAVVNVEAFGWRLPLHLFPAQWARLTALALLASALAAAIPLARLARTPPARLTQVFANER
ncbi:MAG: FtsX-like permease family protein [Pseudomonadota bacterium]